MVKYIQFIFLFIFSLLCLTISAQNERVKIFRAEQKPSLTQDKISTPNNILEKNDIPQIRNEIDKSSIQLRSEDSVLFKNKNTGQQNNIDLNTTDRILFPDNVTYVKVDIEANEKVISSEKKSTKVIPSANYKPRIIKEDILPAADYSQVQISPNKRAYLQQEADDLQQEINQNSKNVNYDLTEKQKQLEEIKKMLQN